MIGDRVKFQCPNCNVDTNVRQTTTGVNWRRRRRECPQCLDQFLTFQRGRQPEEYDCPVFPELDRNGELYHKLRQRVKFLKSCVKGDVLLEQALDNARRRLGIMTDE